MINSLIKIKMEETKKEGVLDRHLKKTTITSNLFSIGVALITAIVVSTGFFSDTKNTLKSQDSQIRCLEIQFDEIDDKIDNIKVFQGVSEEQIRTLELQINDVKSSQLRIESKLDKVIEKL
jgi:hypothetical protein